MKLPFRANPPPRGALEHDIKRIVVELDVRSMAYLKQFPANPGPAVFLQVAGGGEIIGENLVRVNDKLVQVQSAGIQHGWTWDLEDGISYAVLVWPFHAPMSWQVVGYHLTEGLYNPTSWRDFTPFKRSDEDKGIYSAPSPSNGRLRTSDPN